MWFQAWCIIHDRKKDIHMLSQLDYRKVLSAAENICVPLCYCVLNVDLTEYTPLRGWCLCLYTKCDTPVKSCGAVCMCVHASLVSVGEVACMYDQKLPLCDFQINKT